MCVFSSALAWATDELLLLMLLLLLLVLRLLDLHLFVVVVFDVLLGETVECVSSEPRHESRSSLVSSAASASELLSQLLPLDPIDIIDNVLILRAASLSFCDLLFAVLFEEEDPVLL